MRKQVKFLVVSVLLVMGLSGNVHAGNSVDSGVFRGSIRDVFPNAVVTNIFILNNAGTSGLSTSPVDFFQKTFREVINGFSSYGTENCNSKYHAVEQLDVKTAFNSSSNLLVTVIGNVVCFNLPENKSIVPDVKQESKSKKKK